MMPLNLEMSKAEHLTPILTALEQLRIQPMAMHVTPQTRLRMS